MRLELFEPDLPAEVRAAIDCDPETWAIVPNPTGEGFESYWSAACGARLDERMYMRTADARTAVLSDVNLLHVTCARAEWRSEARFCIQDARGGPANPEAKMLLLSHAFASGAVARATQSRHT